MLHRTLGVIFIAAFILTACLACTSRDRDNILDPSNHIDSLDLSLSIQTADSVISLRWAVPRNLDYNGFNLYRRSGSLNNFVRLAEIPEGQSTYTDRTVKTDSTYEYYLTVRGYDVESAPTVRVSVTPGPGTFWLLDRWDYNIVRLSYDLKHRLKTQYAIWVPEQMCFSTNFAQALITYPQYRYAEIFDPHTGQIINGLNNMRNPYSCVYVPADGAFWIGDSSGGVYKAEPNGTVPAMVSSFPQRPVQINYDSENNIYIRDSKLKTVLVYNLSGGLLTNLSRIGSIELINPIFMEMSSRRTELYILDRITSANYIVYRYNTLNGQAEELLREQSLARLRVSAEDNTLWISQNLQDTASILQLSYSGERLKKLEGFSHIEDFELSSYTGNLIVADSQTAILTHLRADGSVIGTYENAFFPYRVYNE